MICIVEPKPSMSLPFGPPLLPASLLKPHTFFSFKNQADCTLFWLLFYGFIVLAVDLGI